jgi:PilZ domain
MADLPKDGRPRAPRFQCGGLATMSRLPSNGIFLPGKLLDLSIGGCCVDTTLPVECGVRTELVVHVNTASFRAVGEVRSVRRQSEACIQFIYLSKGGKNLLAELVAELAMSEALMSQLRLGRREIEIDAYRKQRRTRNFWPKCAVRGFVW